ncbi:MAG: serine/threonine protein kinase [Planctomycetia bacterium]|nr:serine/threonine protein kinase [Planctomycetia bacterium]
MESEATQRPPTSYAEDIAAHPYLKNRIARVVEHIDRGAFGAVYLGELENLFGLIAERVWLGESALAPLLGIPAAEFEARRGDPEMRHALYVASHERWTQYRHLREQSAEAAEDKFHDILQVIDPALVSRQVAIKVLRPALGPAGDRESEARLAEIVKSQFLRECRVLAALNHRNIVRYFGLVDDPHYGLCMILEYLNGVTLFDGLTKGLMPPDKAVELAIGIAEALRYCHEGPGHPPVLHRDLKPGNIMIVSEESGMRPVLIDFGIGKFAGPTQTQLTMPGAISGTPRYMAPEQWEGDSAKITAATDMYALSLVLFEMLAGEPAYGTNDDVTALRTMALNPRLPHPKGLRDFEHLRGISRRLEDLVEIGRRKDPSKRWTMGEFILQAKSIFHTRIYEQPPEEPKSLTELRIEKKIHDWRSEQIDTRIHFLKIEEDVAAAAQLMRAQRYEEAGAAMQAIVKDVLPLPRRYDPLKRELLRRLLALAWLESRAGLFPALPGALDSARSLLGTFPSDDYPALFTRFRYLERRFEPHKAVVLALNVIQANFVNDVRRAMAALNCPADPAKVRELQGRVETGKAMFAPLDPRLVGTAAHKRTSYELDQLAAALANLLDAGR